MNSNEPKFKPGDLVKFVAASNLHWFDPSIIGLIGEVREVSDYGVPAHPETATSWQVPVYLFSRNCCNLATDASLIPILPPDELNKLRKEENPYKDKRVTQRPQHTELKENLLRYQTPFGDLLIRRNPFLPPNKIMILKDAGL